LLRIYSVVSHFNWETRCLVGKFIQHNIIRFASIFDICNEQLFCGWHACTGRVESVLEWLVWQCLSEHRPILL
jgi:hypothetical protein